MVIARWILPIKIKLRREELSAMLIIFIFNGTDISKFLGFLDESYILVNIDFVYSIMGKLYTLNKFFV
jgi:hypothetical protein